MAFSVVDYVKNIPLNDPNFIQWLVLIRNKDGSTYTAEELKFHRCTKEDFDSFYPSQAKSAKAIERAEELFDMMCIDENQDISIFGESTLN